MDSKIRIRRMDENDVAQVSLIERQIFSIPWSETAFLTSIKQEHTRYLVAEAEQTGQIAGYCGFYQSFDEAEITNVAVKMEYRRQHIAEKMLTYLLAMGKDEGIEKFALEVRESNFPAIYLYQRLGFDIEGTRKRFYEKPMEDAVIMCRRK